MTKEGDPCRERPLDLVSTQSHCLASFKASRIMLFMIPLEETSQAGFCFSAVNG
jgi:hypothetical protein